MVINPQTVISACVLLWVTMLYYITSKPLACAFGYAFIQAIMLVFVHPRIHEIPLNYMVLDVSLMSLFVLGFFQLLDRISDHDRLWKAVFAAGALLAVAGNFILLPRMNEYLRESAPIDEISSRAGRNTFGGRAPFESAAGAHLGNMSGLLVKSPSTPIS